MIGQQLHHSRLAKAMLPYLLASSVLTGIVGCEQSSAPPAAADQGVAIHPLAQTGNAATPERISYNRDIRPILSDKCFACHGFDDKTREAGLRLDIPHTDSEEEQDTGAIVPGDPDASAIIQRITTTNPRRVMPPPESHKSISADELALLRQWIQEGAVYEGHWAFIPPEMPQRPEVSNPAWVRNEIDRFVLAKIESAGMAPSPEADRRTLIRRVHLDLTGVPPTPEEVEAFVADQATDAYEQVVDRLLASPHYGERMALPWLDAARYADSNSYQYDDNRFAWPWRDWLVRALNDNRRFDEVIVEMLAGDLLPNPTRGQLLATSFNRNHFINGEGGAIAEEVRFNYVLDRVETTSTTFLGLTYACAQCHDHKYDPISQDDYYRFFAFFGQTAENGRTQRNVETWDFRYRMSNPMMQLADADQLAEFKRLQQHETQVYQQNKAEVSRAEHEAHEWARLLPADQLSDLPPMMREIVERAKYREGFPVAQMRRKMVDYYAEHVALIESPWLPGYRLWREAIQARMAYEQTIPWVMVMGDQAKPREIHRRERGLYNMPIGDPLLPGLPDSLGGLPDDLPRNRLGLARWIVSDQNPLTARVLVNRVWQQVFGMGLVKTPEDFGLQGEMPSHPDLLDYLAVQFRTHWDTKALVRSIVTSATYRQQSSVSPHLLETDPENRLLARGPRFRLPAMLIRDQALAVSGLMNPQMFGPPVYPYQPPGLWIEVSFGQFEYKQSSGDDLYRRSIYTFFRRTLAPPNLFDNANRQACSVKPSLTNTPLHALVTLNDPTYVEAARALALRAMQRKPDASIRVLAGELIHLTLLRPAEPRELDVLEAAYQRELAWYRDHPDSAAAYLGVGQLSAPDQVDSNHLAALSSVALTVLNLDETLTKP